MTWEELHAALEVFGLGERATMREIRSRHRRLVRRYHPDAGGKDEAAIRRVNDAYRIISEYLRDYTFCFGREEYLAQNPEERLRMQFSWDPVWGGKEEQ